MERKILGKEAKEFEGFVSNRAYCIPSYQREYKWNRKNWSSFWNSVYKMVNDSGVHFIGNFITKRKRDKTYSESEYDIIDGHQRLATFFLFWAAFIKVIEEICKGIKEENKRVAFISLKAEIERLIFIDPIGIKKKVPRDEIKLTLRSGEETRRFKNVISRGGNIKSSFLPKKAFDFFYEKLKNSISKHSYEIATKFFIALKEKIVFTVIELDEESTISEVLYIFRTLNETGEKFGPADTTKCFLFVKCEEEMGNTELIEEVWERMESNFEGNQSKINNFLYNFLASRYERNKELKSKEFSKFAEEKISKELREISENQKKQEKPKPVISVFLLEIFDRYSKVYKVITEPLRFTFEDEQQKKESNFKREFRLLLADIKKLGYTQLNKVSLVLYFDENLKESEKLKILGLLIKYAFRKVTFKDLKASKILEKPSQDWIKWLLDKQGRKILKESRTIDEFSKESNEEMYNKLETQIFPEKVYKYLLKKYYSVKIWPGFLSYNEKAELEYLVPKNEKDGEPNLPNEWKKIEQWNNLSNDKKKLSKVIFSIGNTTIIDDIANRASQDDLWTKKVEKEGYIKNIGIYHEEKEMRERQNDLKKEISNLTKKYEEEKKPKVKKTLLESLKILKNEQKENEEYCKTLFIEKGKNKEELLPEDISKRTKRLVKGIKKQKTLEFDF